MKIIGIDPGLVQTGYGIISIKNEKIKIVDYGIVKPNKELSLAFRLNMIFKDVCELIENYKPSVFVIEEVFYGKNVKSALKLGQARGAAMVAGASAGLLIYEYSAKKVKQSITGSGNSKKEQVQFMVQQYLNMNSLPYPIDASDALAIALCHYQQFRMEEI